jgi:hypothetical protein
VAAGWVDGNPEIYRELARRHAAGIVPLAADATGHVLHTEAVTES